MLWSNSLNQNCKLFVKCKIYYCGYRTYITASHFNITEIKKGLTWHRYVQKTLIENHPTFHIFTLVYLNTIDTQIMCSIMTKAQHAT